jgi:hypothetical protein
MRKIKSMLTVGAALALMLLAGAGSAAFAGPPGNPDTGIKGPPKGNLGPQQKPPPQTITGGVGVPNGKYPFIAALFDMKRGESAYKQFACGGTLIDSDSVLTAAHCLYYPDKYSDGTPYPKAGQLILRTDLRVVVGGTQLSEQSIPNAGVKPAPQGQLGPQQPSNPDTGIKGPPKGNLGPQQPCTPTAGIKCPPQGQLGPQSSTQGQVRAVSRISIPGSWDHENIGLGWDVAVLKLTSPVTGITPVQLPLSTDNGYEQAGTLLRIAGWGSAMKGGAVSDRMQEAKVPVVSDADAEKSWSSNFVPELMMAAGEKGTDVCKGDSGGPLFRIPKTLRGAKPIAPYQYGITSFGGPTCGGTDPSVYTEVNAPSIREYIVSSMNK